MSVITKLNSKLSNPYFISIGIHIILFGIFSIVKLRNNVHSSKYISIDVVQKNDFNSTDKIKKLLSKVTDNTATKTTTVNKKNNIFVAVRKKFQKPTAAKLKLYKGNLEITDIRKENVFTEKIDKIIDAENKIEPLDKPKVDEYLQKKDFTPDVDPLLTKADRIDLLGHSEEKSEQGESKGSSNKYNVKWVSGPSSRALVYKTKIQYPDLMSKRNIQGSLKLKFTVNPEGYILKTVIIQKGYPDLDSLVLAEFQKWRFESLPDDVEQQDQIGIVTINFRLK